VGCEHVMTYEIEIICSCVVLFKIVLRISLEIVHSGYIV